MMMRFLSLALLALLSNAAAAVELPLVAAARKREEATRSVEFVIKSKMTIPRGGISPDSKPGFEPLPTRPEADRQIESTTRLIFDGPRGRWEDDGPVGPTWPSPINRLTTQNGRETRVLIDFRSNDNTRFAGAVDQPYLTSGTAKLPAPDPILFAFRLSQLLGEKTPVEPTGTITPIDGAACEGYRLGARWTVWADPNQDYAIKRVESTVSSHYVFEPPHAVQQDIRYERHGVVGWRPASWTVTDAHPSGRVAHTVTAVATVVRVGEKFADDLFETTFPQGMEVSDHVRNTQFVVGPDGQELPPKPTPARPASRPSKPWNQYQWVGAALVAVGLAFAVLVVGRRFQLRRRNRPALGDANFIT